MGDMSFNAIMRAAFAVAALAPLAAAAQAPIRPQPGKLETYKDWTIGCDNRNRCEAVSLFPEDGEIPDNPVLIGIVREAGPEGATSVWISRDARGPGSLTLMVDGRAVAMVQSKDGEATLRGPQADAAAIAIARGSALEVRSGGRVVGKPSLAGSGAALRYMDARQGRAGTTSALVASGPLGPSAVRPAPAAPVIRRAAVPAGPAPAPLWREELTTLGALTKCADEMKDAGAPEQHPLSRTETLILVPCGMGAYNATVAPVIATGVQGRRTFRLADFDYKPAFGEPGASFVLVNAGWSADKSELTSFAKGRGIGDCGGSETWVWDGARFRLTEATAMGECRGAWRWIRTWSARVEG